MNKEDTICYMERIMREYGVSRSEIADKVKSTRQYIGLLAAGDRLLTNKMLYKLESNFPLSEKIDQENIVSIPFLDNNKDFLYVDKRCFKNTNLNHCKIYEVTGNSMSPVYNDKDKVIVDSSMKSFIDGHIFLFKYNNNLFMRLINVSPDKIKCISLNKEFDTFYLDSTVESMTVIGLIIPRIRL